MVDTDDTRRTTDDERRTTDAGQRHGYGIYKLPTGELKTVMGPGYNNLKYTHI